MKKRQKGLQFGTTQTRRLKGECKALKSTGTVFTYCTVSRESGIIQSEQT